MSFSLFLYLVCAGLGIKSSSVFQQCFRFFYLLKVINMNSFVKVKSGILE